MGRKICLAFLVLLALSGLGGVAASLYVTRAADELEALLGLHKIENLRRTLVIDVQSVQADLYTLNTPQARDLDEIVANVFRLQGAAAGCRSCHHSPELVLRLEALSARIEDYQEALSYYITARANRDRIERIQLNAAAIGDQILRQGEEMSLAASQRLDRVTRAATARMRRVRPILAATGLGVLLLGVAVAVHLTRSVTRPVRRLVAATRVLAGGELGHTVVPEGTPEFAELTRHFNAMSAALREQYDRIQEANTELEAEIAERRRTEEALRLDEIRLRAMLDLSRMVDASAPEVSEFVLDRSLSLTQSWAGFVALVEEGGRRLSHCAHRAPEGKGCALAAPCGEDPVSPEAPWAPAVASGTPLLRNGSGGEGPRLLAVPVSEKGRVVALAVMAGASLDYADADVQHLTLLLHGLWQQVTRRRTEEDLLRAQKLESVGILAGGIAHDFNNLLTGILANVSLAQGHTDPDGRVRERLGEVEKACARAQSLTQQLLTFSRGGEPVRQTMRLGDMVRESATFALTGANVRCDFLVPEDLWFTAADPGQVAQVVSNLVINAEQAMPSGGTVTVACENVEARGDDGLPVAPGRYVRVSVADQGCGIPASDLPRIFDPYFTTKPGGSGLGLAVAYSVVRRHGGHLAVASEPGAGAAFHIYLPACDGQETRPDGGRAEDAPPPAAATGRRRDRILVMDDDDLIRDVAAQILEDAGFDVATAADGESAVGLYRQAREAGEPFAAAVLDLTVPGGMGGLQALEKLRELDPGVRAVVSSGYSNDPAIAEYERYGFRARITKPYRMEDFLNALGKVLRPGP